MSVTEADSSVSQPLSDGDIGDAPIIYNEAHNTSTEPKEIVQPKEELNVDTTAEPVEKATIIVETANSLASEVDNVVNIQAPVQKNIPLDSDTSLKVDADNELHATDVASSFEDNEIDALNATAKKQVPYSSLIENVILEPKEVDSKEQPGFAPVEQEETLTEAVKDQSADMMTVPDVSSAAPDTTSIATTEVVPSTIEASQEEVPTATTQPELEESIIAQPEPITTASTNAVSKLTSSFAEPVAPSSISEELVRTQANPEPEPMLVQKIVTPDTISADAETLPIESSATSAIKSSIEVTPAEAVELGMPAQQSIEAKTLPEEETAQLEAAPDTAESLPVAATSVEEVPADFKVVGVAEAANEIPVAEEPVKLSQATEYKSAAESVTAAVVPEVQEISASVEPLIATPHIEDTIVPEVVPAAVLEAEAVEELIVEPSTVAEETAPSSVEVPIDTPVEVVDETSAIEDSVTTPASGATNAFIEPSTVAEEIAPFTAEAPVGTPTEAANETPALEDSATTPSTEATNAVESVPAVVVPEVHQTSASVEPLIATPHIEDRIVPETVSAAATEAEAIEESIVEPSTVAEETAPFPVEVPDSATTPSTEVTDTVESTTAVVVPEVQEISVEPLPIEDTVIPEVVPAAASETEVIEESIIEPSTVAEESAPSPVEVPIDTPVEVVNETSATEDSVTTPASGATNAVIEPSSVAEEIPPPSHVEALVDTVDEVANEIPANEDSATSTTTPAPEVVIEPSTVTEAPFTVEVSADTPAEATNEIPATEDSATTPSTEVLNAVKSVPAVVVPDVQETPASVEPLIATPPMEDTVVPEVVPATASEVEAIEELIVEPRSVAEETAPSLVEVPDSPSTEATNAVESTTAVVVPEVQETSVEPLIATPPIEDTVVPEVVPAAASEAEAIEESIIEPSSVAEETAPSLVEVPDSATTPSPEVTNAIESVTAVVSEIQETSVSVEPLIVTSPIEATAVPEVGAVAASEAEIVEKATSEDVSALTEPPVSVLVEVPTVAPAELPVTDDQGSGAELSMEPSAEILIAPPIVQEVAVTGSPADILATEVPPQVEEPAFVEKTVVVAESVVSEAAEAATEVSELATTEFAEPSASEVATKEELVPVDDIVVSSEHTQPVVAEVPTPAFEDTLLVPDIVKDESNAELAEQSVADDQSTDAEPAMKSSAPTNVQEVIVSDSSSTDIDIHAIAEQIQEKTGEDVAEPIVPEAEEPAKEVDGTATTEFVEHSASEVVSEEVPIVPSSEVQGMDPAVSEHLEMSIEPETVEASDESSVPSRSASATLVSAGTSEDTLEPVPTEAGQDVEPTAVTHAAEESSIAAGAEAPASNEVGSFLDAVEDEDMDVAPVADYPESVLEQSTPVDQSSENVVAEDFVAAEKAPMEELASVLATNPEGLVVVAQNDEVITNPVAPSLQVERETPTTEETPISAQEVDPPVLSEKTQVIDTATSEESSIAETPAVAVVEQSADALDIVLAEKETIAGQVVEEPAPPETIVEPSVEEISSGSAADSVVAEHQEIPLVAEESDHPEGATNLQDQIEPPQDVASASKSHTLSEATSAAGTDAAEHTDATLPLTATVTAEEVPSEELVLSQDEVEAVVATIPSVAEPANAEVPIEAVKVLESVVESTGETEDELKENVEESVALNVGADVERPTSPWMPSFQVTTVGHGVPPDERLPEPGMAELGVDAFTETQTGMTKEEEPHSAEQPPVPVLVTTDAEEILKDGEQPSVISPELFIDTPLLVDPAETEGSFAAPEEPRPWTPSYSVHSQGSPRPDNIDHEVEAQEPSTRPWTPSYSVHSQGSPRPTQITLLEESTPPDDGSFVKDQDEGVEMEEIKFANNEDSPAIIPSSASLDQQGQSQETSTNTSSNEEQEALAELVPSLTNEHSLGLAGPSNETPIISVHTEVKDSSEAIATSALQVDGDRLAETAPPVPVTEPEVPLMVLNASEEILAPSSEQFSEGLAPDTEERPASPWVASYSVVVQGSPAQERPNPLDETAVITEHDVTKSETVVVEQIETLAISTKDAPEAETQSYEVPPSVEIAKGDGMTRTIEEIVKEPIVKETLLTPLVGDDRAEELPIKAAIASESYTDLDNQERLKSLQTPGHSVTTKGSSSADEEELNKLELEAQKVFADNKNIPSTAVEVADTAVSTVRETFPPTEPIAEQPKKPGLRLTTLDDNVVTDDSPTSSDAIPPATGRSRLESTASSRFFPGAWFSPSKTVDESRAFMEVAKGEFTAKKLGTARNPSIDEGPSVAQESTETQGVANKQPLTASNERKSRWCVIM